MLGNVLIIWVLGVVFGVALAFSAISDRDAASPHTPPGECICPSVEFAPEPADISGRDSTSNPAPGERITP